MGVGTLLRRRLLTHPVALVAVATSVLMSMVVVATLQLLSSAIADASVRTTLDVPGEQRSVALTAGRAPGELADVDRRVRAALARGGPDAVVTRTSTVTSRGIEGRDETDRAVLADLADLTGRARLTAGAWPAAPGDDVGPGGAPSRWRCRWPPRRRSTSPWARGSVADRPRTPTRSRCRSSSPAPTSRPGSTTACGSTTRWDWRGSAAPTSRPTARSWPPRGPSTARSPGRRPRPGGGCRAGATSPPTTSPRCGPTSSRSSTRCGTRPASCPTAPRTRTARSVAHPCATPGSARGCPTCSTRRPWSASACASRCSPPRCCSSCSARHRSSWRRPCWRRCATARPG